MPSIVWRKRDWVFLPVVAILGGVLGVDLFPPIYNMKVTSDNPHEPGGVFTLTWKYDRLLPARIVHVDRQFVCDDGIVRVPETEIDGGGATWPSGFNQTASLRIKIPEGSKGRCYYSGHITYDRIILPDLTIKNPPVDILVQVNE
jgi:hypothetical protein